VSQAPAAPAFVRGLQDEQSPGAVADSVLLFYEEYRESWRTLHTQLTGKLALLPEDQRAATLHLLRQRFPALEQEEQFRVLRGAVGANVAAPVVPAASVAPKPEVAGATNTGSLTLLRAEWAAVAPSAAEPPSLIQPEGLMPERAIPHATDGRGRSGALPQSPIESGVIRPVESLDGSTSLLRIFAQTYASESTELRSTEDVEQFLHQLAAVLEAFGKSFLELRRGHDQFGKEIAVPVTGDQTPLRHAKTPRDLLRYLLDCDGQAGDRIRSLTEGFADVMIRQVALLNGIRQGISALLTHLSPEELRRSSALARTGAGSVLLKVWPVRALALWGPYVARHQELLQEEREVQSIVFGSEFAFAYAQIVGGNVKSPPRKAGPN
jgi:predicted component of type VI protein secretion system